MRPGASRFLKAAAVLMSTPAAPPCRQRGRAAKRPDHPNASAADTGGQLSEHQSLSTAPASAKLSATGRIPAVSTLCRSTAILSAALQRHTAAPADTGGQRAGDPRDTGHRRPHDGLLDERSFGGGVSGAFAAGLDTGHRAGPQAHRTARRAQRTPRRDTGVFRAGRWDCSVRNQRPEHSKNAVKKPAVSAGLRTESHFPACFNHFRVLTDSDNRKSRIERNRESLTSTLHFRFSIAPPIFSAKPKKMAEGEGFEPPVPCGTVVFKTTAFVHSAIPP